MNKELKDFETCELVEELRKKIAPLNSLARIGAIQTKIHKAFLCILSQVIKFEKEIL